MAIAAFGSLGCSNRAGDCELNGNCGGASASSHAGGASGSTSRGSTSATGGNGGGAPACQGATPDGAPIDETCAVFVQAAVPEGGDGSRAMPLASIADAITMAHAKNLRVYACGMFVEEVLAKVPFDLWGGFDCSPTVWSWNQNNQARLSVPAGEIPLRADVDGIASIHNFSLTSPGGPSAMPGASSVAVMFGPKADAIVDRCTIVAGDGVAGAEGPPTGGAEAAFPGSPPSGDCTISNFGTGGTLSCLGGMLVAGDGGPGGLSPNALGKSGNNGTLSGMLVAVGGAGETSTAPCKKGELGLNGAHVSDGSGGVRDDIAFDITASAQTGSFPFVTGGDGIPGMPGLPGWPGGGGGGAKAGSGACYAGGAGSAGSTGSCGGHPGSKGQAGGSSIGIACAGTKLVLTDSAISTSAGQTGGLGVKGGSPGLQATPHPGFPGQGANSGCTGGLGGSGSPGGNGGGGRGGHSVDVAFLVTPTVYTFDAKTMFTHPSMAALGGGSTGSPAPSLQGAPGLTQNCWVFASGKACAMTKEKP